MQHSCFRFDKHYVLTLLFTTAIYTFSSRILSDYLGVGDLASLLSMASGMGLAIVLIGGNSYAPGIFLGGVLSGTLSGLPLWTATLVSLGHTLGVLITTNRLARDNFDPALAALSDWRKLLVWGSVVGCGISHIIGSTAIELTGQIDPQHDQHQMIDEWIGCGLGVMLITPVVLSGWRLSAKDFNLNPLAEALLILGLSFLSGQAVFLGWFDDYIGDIANGYWLFLFISWSALRLKKHWTTLMILMLSVQALLGVYEAAGVFARNYAENRILNYWCYSAVLAAVGAALGTYVTTDKQARRHQQEALERLQKIASRLPGVVYQFRLNPDGTSCLPYASPAIEDIYRVSPLDVQDSADKIFAILHPDDAPQVSDSIAFSAKNLSPWQLEYRVQFADGTVRWLFGNSIPQRETDGSTLWHGFITDITERKQMEMALRESRDELLHYFEQPFIGMFRADNQRRMTNVNRYFCEMLGYSKSEIIGVKDQWQQITHPDDMNISPIYLDKIERGEIDYYQIEKRYIHKNGNILYVQVFVTSQRDQQGTLEYLIGIILDITERKQMELALQASHEELKQYFEQPFIGMLTAGHHKKTIHVNQRFCDMVGYSPEEMKTIDWGMITHPDDLAPNQVYLEQAIRGEIDAYQMEKRYIHKDGHLVYVDLAVKCIRHADGSPNYFIGMMLDITERKQAEQILKKYAHDLNERLKELRCLYTVSELARRDELSPQQMMAQTIDALLRAYRYPEMTACRVTWYEQQFNSNNFQITPWLQQTVIQVYGKAVGLIEICYLQAVAHDDEVVFLDEEQQLLDAVALILGKAFEHRQVQQEKNAAQQQLEATLNAIPDLLFEVDKAGRFYGYHTHCPELLAAPPEQFLGKTVFDVLPSDAVAVIMEALQQAAEQGWSMGKQFKLDLPDDGQWFELSVALKSSDLEQNPHFIVLSRNITERKQMEETLTASQAFIASILNSLTAHIAVLNAEGQIMMVNQAWREFGAKNGLPPSKRNMLNYNYLEVCQQTLKETDDPDLAHILNGIMAVLTETLPSFHAEYPCHSPDERRWFQMTVSPLQGFEHKGIVISHENITSRKLLEQQLHKSQRFFQLLANVSPVGIYQSDAEGSCIFVNPRWCEITGMDSGRALGEGWREAVLPADRDLVDRTWQSAVREKRQFSLEYRFQQPNGKLVWVYGLSNPIYDEMGYIAGYIGTITDITQLKQMQADLRENEEKFRTLFTQAPLGIALIDSLSGHIYKANQKYADIVGLTLDELQNINWMQITHPDDVQADLDNMALMNTGKTSGFTMEKRYIRPDGSIVWVNLTVAPLNLQNRSTPCHHCIVEDITERKRLEQNRQESELMLKEAQEIAHVGHWMLDIPSNTLFWSDEIYRLFGLAPQQFSASLPVYIDYVHPDDRRYVIERYREHLENQSDYEIEHRIVAKDGSIKYVVEKCKTYFDDNNEPERLIGVVLDITERKKAETELRIAAIVFESQEGMLITDTHGVILRINHAFTTITGYTEQDAIGRTHHLLHSNKQDKAFYADLWVTLQQHHVWRGEVEIKDKSGKTFPAWLTITAVQENQQNIITHYVATLIDITERKATEERIHHLAFYDSLTQLPNRRLLEERLKHGIEISSRTNRQMAVLMLDLDKFKAVNDTLGHSAGDELLRLVAQRMQSRLREMDTVARLGGDEFVILMEEIDDNQHIAHIATNVIQALSQPFMIYQSHEAYVGVSIGIALYPEHGDDAETLLDNADTALYHAKDQGRGCFAYFSEELTQKARERVALERRLRRAIEQDELRVHFQPQVDINSGQIIGAEALVRWQTPESCLMPNDFIYLAEETGIIADIGEWVLRQTCVLGRQWLDKGLPPLVLAVNVSPHQFRRSNINGLVTGILQETGFPAHNLELEITESGLMESQQQALTLLNQLHDQGVRLAIDDFGTGYSSLAYLKYFPLDVLKIDKTFIDDIPASEDDKAITATIISMAHHLGFKVLAEGVETQQQLDFLHEQGCDYYQGYFYKLPLTPDEFTALLTRLPVQSGRVTTAGP